MYITFKINFIKNPFKCTFGWVIFGYNFPLNKIRFLPVVGKTVLVLSGKKVYLA